MFKEYVTYSFKHEVIHKYKLCRKNGIWQTKMYNSLIGGAALEGKVLAVDGEKVKLHLDIDKNQDKGEAAWFPYAPPTGSTMYSMPIVGTNARLYFPDENGEGPVVTGCVRKNGGSCAKTADTTKRYFGTEHGSELEMTPGAINIKGGSKEPLNVSFDDKVGVTITSPKKLTLNADEEVIIKTPESVKIKGESQILALKKDSQSGISIETDMHFKSNNVIEDGKDRESYPNFKDEPKQGTKPEPPKPPEKKKGFSWGKLLVAAVAVVAVAVSVATFGVGAVVAAAVIGACVGAACAVASTAIGDLASGKTSSLGTYAKNALRGAFTGAISGAVFGPFGAFESVGGMMLFGGINGMADSLINQAIDGEFSFKQTVFDGVIGGLTAGLLHGAGKVFKKSMPYLKNVLEDVQQKAGTLFENASAFVKKAANKISNEIEIAGKKILNNAADKLDNAFNSIYRKADELTYNMTKKLGAELQPASGPRGYHPPDESNFFKDTLSRMVKDGEESIDDTINNINKNYRQKIDEALANGDKDLANDFRYDRYCKGKELEGKRPKSREEWDKLNETIRNNSAAGYKNEPVGRDSLRNYLGKSENELINNNNSGNIYTHTVDGKTVRPDSVVVNGNGEIELVHDHKHFLGGKNQELYNDAQMKVERDMLSSPNGKHVVTMSSDAPNINGVPPQPRPSGPLSELSDVYYTDLKTKKITHVWSVKKGKWVPVN